MDWLTWFVYTFNRIALGIGVLVGLYSAVIGNWKGVAVIFLFLIPIYFIIHDLVDAPESPVEE